MADNSHFEEQLSRLHELDDPLSVYESYYNFLVVGETDAVTITRVLEKATQTFVEDRRYRNDPRYLRLWLSYAQKCREPEDIYAFLAMRGIACDLASYYEEYAQYMARKGDLSKAEAVLQAGVERSAQPIQRLCKTFSDFTSKHAKTLRDRHAESPLVSERSKPTEVRGYRVDLVEAVSGESTFEEQRARSWRKSGGILKATYNPPIATPPIEPADGDLDEFDLGLPLLPPIDPDNLTHISVYKDNTADLRELVRSLDKSHGTAPAKENSLAAHNVLFEDFILAERPPKGLLEEEQLPNLARSSRLSLIPEESDAATQVSGLIKSLLKTRPSVSHPVVVSSAQMKQYRLGFRAAHVEGAELVMPRVLALERSAGRDGVGSNHTVASLKIAAGLYFIERRLGSNLFVAVDLEANVSDNELHQSVLAVSEDFWEPHVLARLAPSAGVPTVSTVSKHPDVIITSRTYYPHGSVSQVSQVVDEKLVLFWFRDLVRLLSQTQASGIIHGQVCLENVMVRLGVLPVSGAFDPDGAAGWLDRGVALTAFSRAIDTTLLEQVGCDVLDEELVSHYREKLGDGCPVNAHALDVFGLAGCLTALLKPLLPTMRYRQTWRSVEELLQDALDDPTPARVAGTYEALQRVCDATLIPESVVLPTLKSLLTRLEIILLERTTQSV